jgi:glycosyltransferase involved in cell wall biosynthesis
MRALKVAFDNSLTAGNWTGTGVYALQLIQNLAANEEIQLTVFNGWGFPSGNGSVARKIRRIGNVALAHGYVPLALRMKKIDVMHGPNFIVPLRCPCPTVVTIHDVSFLSHPHHFGRAWRTYVTSLMPSVLRSAGGIICVSESAKRDLLSAYEIAEKKVHVVHNGLDHARFHTGTRLDEGWAYSVGIAKRYLLHVGVFAERKNIPVLLRAVAKLRDAGNFEGCQLVLAGKEPPGVVGARSIDDTIRDFHLHEVVLKLGHVPDNKLAGLYAGAALLVMPSMYEGFGFPVLEAMATGTPVIASNASSLPEIAGDAAVLVAPGDESALADAIHALLEDDVRRQELRAKGLAQAQKFDWKRTVEQTIAVYRAVARR